MADPYKTELISGTDKDRTGMLIGAVYNVWSGRELTSAYAALAWKRDEKIVGIAVFDNYTGANINIHIHGPGIMSKRKIKDAYKYAFKQLNCRRITATVSSANKSFIQLINRFGFVYECTISEYFGTPDAPEDCLVFKLSREAAEKWME